MSAEGAWMRNRLAVADQPVHATPGDMDPLVWFVGAHGGAGTSSLAAAIAPAGDAGRIWPAGDTYPWVVVVSRSTLSGLEKAHDAVLQARAGKAGGCQVLGLAVVADAPGKFSRIVQEKLAVIRGLTDVFVIPYQPFWRDHLIEDIPSWPSEDNASAVENPKRNKRRGKATEQPVADEVIELGEALVEQTLALAAIRGTTNTD